MLHFLWERARHLFTNLHKHGTVGGDMRICAPGHLTGLAHTVAPTPVTVANVSRYPVAVAQLHQHACSPP